MAASFRIGRYRGCLALQWQCQDSLQVEQVLAPLAAQVDTACREAAEKRDGPGSLHITVIDPQECTPELEEQLVGTEIPESELCILGIGVAHGCSFAVVHCSRLQYARLAAGLPTKDFHITMGFQGQDRFDVNKGLHSLRAWSDDGELLASCCEQDRVAIQKLKCKPSLQRKLMQCVQEVTHAAGGQELYVADQRRRFLELSLISACLCNHDSGVIDLLCQELGEFDPLSALSISTKFYLRKGILSGKAAADHVHSALRNLPQGTIFDERLVCLAQEAKQAAIDLDCMWGQDSSGSLALLKLPLNCAPVLGTEDKLWGSGCPSKVSLRAVLQLGLIRVVTLTEDPLSCRAESADFKPLRFCHFPIRDRHAPQTVKELLLICRCVQHGLAQVRDQRGGVLVHCMGGKGRTVLVLAAVLMLEEGLSPSAALAQVKANRNVCITEEQTRMLKQLYAATCVRAMRPLSGAVAKPLPKTLPRILVLCGLPGAGKSTFCQELIRQFPANIRHINQDELGGKETEAAWSAAAMSAARGENIVALLDKCLLKQVDRKVAFGCLDIVSQSKIQLVHFCLGVEECAERAAARVDHVGEVTGERARRIVRSMGQTQEPPESVKVEGVGCLHKVQDDNACLELLRTWGCAAETEEEMHCVVGFPRTHHLMNLGAATDDDVQVEDPSPFLMCRQDGDYLTVEEKVDGANLGLRLGEDGYSIVAQNRSHVVHSKYHEQFRKLDKWVLDHTDVLRRILRDHNRILYGEWVYALHSTSYNRLPGHFVAFDLRCVLTDTFVSRSELEAMLHGTGIPLTPLLLKKPLAKSTQEAKALLKEVMDLVYRKSTFAEKALHKLEFGTWVTIQDVVGLNGTTGVCQQLDASKECWVVKLATGKTESIKPANLVIEDTPAEGVYVRIQRESLTIDRAKIVRAGFIAGNERWDKVIKPMELSPEALKAQEEQHYGTSPSVVPEAAPALDAVWPDEAVAVEQQFEATLPVSHKAAPAPDAGAPEAAPKLEGEEPPPLYRSITQHQEILAWLSKQLMAAVGESEAEALVMGVEMILQDEETPFDVVANSVVDMLREESIPEGIVSEFSSRAARLL